MCRDGSCLQCSRLKGAFRHGGTTAAPPSSCHASKLPFCFPSQAQKPKELWPAKLHMWGWPGAPPGMRERVGALIRSGLAPCPSLPCGPGLTQYLKERSHLGELPPGEQDEANCAMLCLPASRLGLGLLWGPTWPGDVCPYLPAVSCSHFSNRAFRACAPEVRGSVCDLTSSRRRSPGRWA